MKYLIFDSGPIISLTMNGMLPIVEKLKEVFDGEFILTSDGFTSSAIWDKFLELVGKSADNIKILYVPTAVNVEEDTSYAEKDKDKIFELGIKKENLIEFDLDKTPNYNLLDDIDSIFVEGGNTFYLLSRIRESGFDKKIISMIDRGVVYVGVSAGSVLACKDVSVALPFDENNYVKNFEGLNLTSKIISSHFQNKEEKIITDFEVASGLDVTRLNDGQAVLVIDDLEEII